jgi:CubicO group peptidase (beta-lactamase class C family)
MRAVFTCLTLFLLIACSGGAPVSVTNSSEARDAEGPLSTVAQISFDPARLKLLTQRLESGWHANVHMVRVGHKGELVYEKYLSGDDQNWGVAVGHREFNSTSLHDLRSVSKSVTSLLLGIALGDDFESALERPIIDYFPEYADRVADGVERVTLHHVLTMSAGFEWNEMEVPYSSMKNDARRMYYARDPVEFALTRPLRSKPGERWYYNGGMTMIIGALIEKISAQPFLEFAHAKLAEPLGISEKYFDWRGLGIWPARKTLPAAASGLRTTLRDLARVGTLVLNGGRWRGQQIVARDWIRISTQRHTEQTFPNWSLDGIYGYGYQWWHAAFRGEYGEFKAITGVGYGGQRLFVIPAKDLVVTIFAGNYGTGLWRVSEQVLDAIIAAMT